MGLLAGKVFQVAASVEFVQQGFRAELRGHKLCCQGDLLPCLPMPCALILCFALEQKGEADMTVTESYLLGIGYKL